MGSGSKQSVTDASGTRRSLIKVRFGPETPTVPTPKAVRAGVCPTREFFWIRASTRKVGYRRA
jgi:hypothetical protein